MNLAVGEKLEFELAVSMNGKRQAHFVTGPEGGFVAAL